MYVVPDVHGVRGQRGMHTGMLRRGRLVCLQARGVAHPKISMDVLWLARFWEASEAGLYPTIVSVIPGGCESDRSDEDLQANHRRLTRWGQRRAQSDETLQDTSDSPTEETGAPSVITRSDEGVIKGWWLWQSAGYSRDVPIAGGTNVRICFFYTLFCQSTVRGSR